MPAPAAPDQRQSRRWRCRANRRSHVVSCRVEVGRPGVGSGAWQRPGRAAACTLALGLRTAGRATLHRSAPRRASGDQQATRRPHPINLAVHRAATAAEHGRAVLSDAALPAPMDEQRGFQPLLDARPAGVAAVPAVAALASFGGSFATARAGNRATTPVPARVLSSVPRRTRRLPELRPLCRRRSSPGRRLSRRAAPTSGPTRPTASPCPWYRRRSTSSRATLPPSCAPGRRIGRLWLAVAAADHAHTGRATRALQRVSAGIPDADSPVRSVRELVRRTDLLYAACFVVISYLVGPRVSEILHLKAGCVHRRSAEGASEPVTVIVGAIFKRQSGYHGRAHEWVAPPAAVQAVAVLEALSAGHRAVAGRDELWLRRRRGNGATEWHEVGPELLEIPSTARVSIQLAALWRLAWPHPRGPAVEAHDASGPQDLRQVRGVARSHVPVRTGPATGSSRTGRDRQRLRRVRLPAQPGDRRRDPGAVGQCLGAHAGGTRPGRTSRRGDRGESPALSGQAHQGRPRELCAPAGRRGTRARSLRLGLLRLPRGVQRLPRQRGRPEPCPPRAVDLRALPELRGVRAAPPLLGRPGSPLPGAAG